MSAEVLKSLTEAHPACRTVLFADLSMRMVLISESRDAMHREALQAFAMRGRALLTAVDPEPLNPDTACDAAYSVQSGEVAVFLRVPGAPDDALCCLCDPEIDLDAFAADARACLNKLAGVSA